VLRSSAATHAARRLYVQLNLQNLDAARQGRRAREWPIACRIEPVQTMLSTVSSDPRCQHVGAEARDSYSGRSFL
jgi:hypothetical protein